MLCVRGGKSVKSPNREKERLPVKYCLYGVSTHIEVGFSRPIIHFFFPHVKKRECRCRKKRRTDRPTDDKCLLSQSSSFPFFPFPSVGAGKSSNVSSSSPYPRSPFSLMPWMASHTFISPLIDLSCKYELPSLPSLVSFRLLGDGLPVRPRKMFSLGVANITHSYL